MVDVEGVCALASRWKYAGSAGLPLDSSESVAPAETRRTLRNHASRMHRVLTQDEIAMGKQARWLEIEIHGRVQHLSRSLFNMRHLTAIFASHNLLAAIPPQIAQLSLLSVLDLAYNHLTSLPTEIGELSALIHLNLSHNQLNSLPSEMGKLFKLKVLSAFFFLLLLEATDGQQAEIVAACRYKQ